MVHLPLDKAQLLAMQGASTKAGPNHTKIVKLAGKAANKIAEKALNLIK